jgi:hypothetical protein
MHHEIDIYVRRLRASGSTLVVVQVDQARTFGAADPDPALALLKAARRASEGVARQGQTVSVATIVESAPAPLRLAGRSAASKRGDAQPVCPPGAQPRDGARPATKPAQLRM